MREMLKKIIKNRILLLFILIIPTLSPLLKPGYFPMHDDISAMRLLEVDKCLKDGQIPCRWVPDMGFGYGYPQFNYYAPLPYYLMEVFHLGGLGFLDSVKAGFVLSIIFSSLGMYLLARSLWGKQGGVLAAVLYAYLPYRAMDVYVRGAVGELYAYAFLPFIFWSCREVLLGKKKGVLWLGLSLAALLTSHNITSMIFLPYLAAWIIFLLLRKKKSLLPDLKKRVVNLAVGVFWGFGLSAFFVLPAWFERNLVHINTLTGGYFGYLAHFVSFGQLFFYTYWGYGNSVAGPWDEASFTIGIIHWTVAFLAIVLAYILKKRNKIPLVLFWVIAGLTSAFMAHSRSVFIWKAFPITAFVQFPWRFLVLTGFSFSLAGGAIALFFPKGTKSFYYVLGLALMVIFFYAAFFKPLNWLDIKDEEKFSGDNWQKQQTVSIFDYLPVSAKEGPTSAAQVNPLVSLGKAGILNWQKGTNWQRGKVRVEENSQLKLPIYYFPNWEVRANGVEQEINYQDSLGLITFTLEPGEYDIEARLKNTPIRSFANIISFLGLIFIPLYLKKK